MGAPKIRVPLSLLQEQMWGLLRHTGAPGFYHVVLRHRLPTGFDAGLVRAALSYLVQRHEALRTRFPSDAEGPYQSILPALEIDLQVIDVGALSPTERRQEQRRLRSPLEQAAFDQATGPLLRAHLVREGGSAEVIVVLEHLIADDASRSILHGELIEVLAALDDGEEPKLPSLPVQYADFAVWQQKWFTAERQDVQRRYWCQQLGGLATSREIPYATGAVRTDPVVDLNVPPKLYTFVVPAAVRAGLVRVAEASRTGLPVICMTAVQVLMAQDAGDTDTVVMTTYSGRDRPELERVVGQFGSFGFVRTDLSGDPPFELALRRARASMLGLLENHHLPIPTIVEALRAQGTTLTLASVPVAVHFFFVSHDRWRPGTTLAPRPDTEGEVDDEHHEPAKPLDFRFFDDGRQLWGMLAYHAECFESGAIPRLIGDLGRVLSAVAEEPLRRLSQLPVPATAVAG